MKARLSGRVARGAARAAYNFCSGARLLFFRRAPSVPFKRQGGESLCLFSVSSRAAYEIPEGLPFVNTLTDKDIQGNDVAASRSGLVFN